MQILQPLFNPIFEQKQIALSMLRLDLLHKNWNGNKYFKLKYHLQEAEKNGCTTIGSFGGPWSNHLAALAAYGKTNQLQTIGCIRFQGDYKKYPTLVEAKNNGMQLQFYANAEYDFLHQKITQNSIDVENKIYWIPSGGHTLLGVKGCEEILLLDEMKNEKENFIHLFVSVGNGTTLAGIANNAAFHQKVIGVVALKNGEYLKSEIENFTTKNNFELLHNYHFGGFGKTNQQLINFMQHFKTSYGIDLDRVYTAKMMFAIFDLINKNYFPAQSNILAIHTGGLQGNGVN